MPSFFRKPGLGQLALAWLVVLSSVAAGAVGMSPPVLAAPANPQDLLPSCSIKVPEPEPADLTVLARISAEQAIAAALAAYPGARVKAVALDNENGCLVYSVDLSSGLEVKVDAGNGRILRAAWEDEEDYQEPKIRPPKRRPRKP